jgi:hypothetical protein
MLGPVIGVVASSARIWRNVVAQPSSNGPAAAVSHVQSGSFQIS